MSEPTRRAVLTAAFLLTLIPAQRAEAHHRPNHAGGKNYAPSPTTSVRDFDPSDFDPSDFC